ncbi:hypothetical protein vBSenH9_53 [Salmonella phage vB_Sen_H9]|uniref:Uncharacterized protein n=1 Tax=Salmonella phage vB_Sen_I1 TaxID=2723910 RepID=A0A7L5CBI5_9CAUD|nr:hypothetical protein vBSenI1_92 [Salmonella phage vB_Sen_I1]QJA18018.1 hypothetical protein vBSenH9_53 [Salmonella phage vB_Sen_H9]
MLSYCINIQGKWEAYYNDAQNKRPKTLSNELNAAG